VRRIRVAGVSVAVVILIALAGLALFAIDLPRLKTDDMAPSLRKGDLLIACRVCGAPERGDVVRVPNPEKPSELIVRRVVALPGETIEVRKGQLLIEGKPLATQALESLELPNLDGENRGNRYPAMQETGGNHVYRTIEDPWTTARGDVAKQKLDGYFLLSDRRTLNRDSRDFGPIKKSDVRAIVLRVITAGDGDASRQGKVP
jgi:signal peptidase I